MKTRKRTVTVQRIRNRHGGCWFVLHPITKVQFVEYTAQKMRARVLWMYETSPYILGYDYPS